MRPIVEQVYQYRRLLSRCRSEAGLTMAEIEEFAGLEAQLRATPPPSPATRLPAIVRGGSADDRVQLASISATAMRLEGCPFLAPGGKVEVVVDDAEEARSYRFKALVTAFEDDGHQCRATLELVGAPLLLRRRPRTVELVAAA